MKTLSNYTELKNIVNLANYLNIDVRELAENIGENDFEVDNYRFVKESEAVDILIDIYESDPYILGCFNDWFIADNCNIPINAVKALQKAEGFSELGELMLKDGIHDLINSYVGADGYGHAFGSYDHNYDEIEIDGIDYICFRTN
jgi:hypothetical protein